MKNEIVVTFHLFDVKQKVCVYKNGKCIEELYPTLNDTMDTIYALNKEYNINKIDFCGNPSFINKYVKELKTKFTKTPAIEIIPA